MKIKFDVSDQDPSDATKTMDPPKPGVYTMKVHEINPGFSKGDDGKEDKARPRLEVIYEVQDAGEFKNSRVWDYVTFSEGGKRRLDQFLQAFGVADTKKRKGEFDTNAIVGKLAKVRVRGETSTYNGVEQYKARVAQVLTFDGSADEAEQGEELGGDEDDLVALGAAADGGDTDAAATLTTKAEEAGLDPNAYPTWTELADVLQADSGSDDGIEPDLTALGEAADGGDAEAAESLTALASESGIDPDTIPTWSELAAQLLAANDGGGDDGEDLTALAVAADDNGDQEAAARLTELAGEKNLDPNEFGTWAEVAAAIEAAAAEDPFAG